MHSLLLIAHGSRRAQANDEMRELVQQLNTQIGTAFDACYCAFLEIAEPSIAQAIDQAVDDGVKELLVLPYFLASGNHVVNDVPQILAQKQQMYPSLSINSLNYFGNSPQIVEWLMQHIKNDPRN